MKLFQQLLLAPAALGLVAPMGAMAAELNMDGVNKYAASSEQVTSITQFSDVKPTDWAYQALSNLIERYGCVAGYPNGTFKGGQAMTRWEAAALLNACLDRVTEITDELRRLMKEFEKELAITKARVDGLEAKVGELQATQFSTTTKLTGQVRFVMGDVYRGDGYANFGQGSALRNAAKLYGQRAYDGSTGGFQDRSTNMIADPLSQGEAYYYYRAGGNGANTASATYQPSKTFAPQARQLAFSTTWTGFTPGPQTITYVANNTRVTGSTTSLAGTEATGSLLVNTNIPGTNIANPLTGTVGTSTTPVPYAPNRIRASIYTKDGYNTSVAGANAATPTAATGPVTSNINGKATFTSEFVNPVAGRVPGAVFTGNDILLQDRYGNDTALRVQTSNSSSSNYSDAKILLDRKDMNALVALANQARRVKTYDYSGKDGVRTTKPANQFDPITLTNAQGREYFVQGTNGTYATLANGAGLTVTPGGYVTNTNLYNNVINYLLAEYGSLGEDQRKVGYVQNAATKFVRNLAAYTTNKNYVADKNAFTFSHDAYLNFDTSFTGKDQFQFRIRANNTYAFAARAADPAASLAYDGATVEWPNNSRTGIFIDKLFYRFPVGDYAVAAVGTRLAQEAILPTRGTYYTKDALLEFFNSSAGVFPSYTGTGVGVALGKLGAKGFGMSGVSFGIAYLANESDAVAPDASNTMTQGWFGADTRFRLPVQLAWQSKDKKWLASANYAFERGNNSMGQVGTQLALTPFMYASLNESNQFGFTLAYQWSKDFSITGAYGHASVNARYDNSVLGVKMADAGDSAVMNSWMVALNFKNVFLKGNSAGFAIGGVPSLVSNSSGWNKDGGMPTAIETWYQFQVTDNISVTPGIFYISSTTNSDGIGGGDVWGGVIKTQFNF
ncbi:iron uptake porin [Synechococcus sp. UW140]|uniref:iron uptake porin n=1 Tax=Synechococcus sp. UW140 TaxID=368503 RepID=UPI00313777B4